MFAEHALATAQHLQFVSFHIHFEQIDSLYALFGAVMIQGLDTHRIELTEVDAEVIEASFVERAKSRSRLLIKQFHLTLFSTKSEVVQDHGGFNTGFLTQNRERFFAWLKGVHAEGDTPETARDHFQKLSFVGADVEYTQFLVGFGRCAQLAPNHVFSTRFHS